MIFGHAKEHKQFGMVPIWLTKLPKCTAHCVDACRRHIDAAKAAMRRIIRGAKILSPEAGKALRLITARKKGQLFRIFVADWFEPARRHIERLIPAYFLKLARTAGPNAFERRV